MQPSIYITEKLSGITPEEFFALVDGNREHIRKTFPTTQTGCATLELTESFLGKAAEKEVNSLGYHFYSRDSAENRLVSYLCVKNIDTKLKKCELAYFTDKAFLREGITSKMVADALTYCFENLQMNKIIICTSLVNEASQRVARKHGFKQEGILRDEFRSGENLLEDIMYFGLTKKDYLNER